MPEVVNTSISRQLHSVLKEHEEVLKGDFLTLRLFIDSAIRGALRKKYGIEPGEDEILPHLAKLEASKARHINRQALAHKRLAHRKRMARERAKLNEILGETNES